ncbi:Uncharacterized protein ACO02O_09022 [Dirofilaria immitis]
MLIPVQNLLNHYTAEVINFRTSPLGLFHRTSATLRKFFICYGMQVNSNTKLFIGFLASLYLTTSHDSSIYYFIFCSFLNYEKHGAKTISYLYSNIQGSTVETL